MKSKAKTNSQLSIQNWRGAGEQNSQSDVCKLVLEAMMTIFIVLVFMFIVQNWVLKKTDDTPFMPTCSLTEGMVEINGSLPCKTNKIIDGYNIN